jgi:hypothetical protein
MTRTLAETHAIMANILDSARRVHDARHSPDVTQEGRENAVTAWRRTAYLISTYANGTDRDTWRAYWEDGMDYAAFLSLITKRSRFNRDGVRVIERDSVTRWELTLAHELIMSESLSASVRKNGKEETIRRLGVESDVTFAVTMAYTGLGPLALMDALQKSAGTAPTYGWVDGECVYHPHALRELITANRPTV